MTENGELKSLIGGKYRILRVLGSGSSAKVYVVSKIDSSGEYVLKLFHPNYPFPEYIDHLLQLQTVLSNIDSENLIVPIDSGFENGAFWQVFKMITTFGTLQKMLDQENFLAPGLALKLFNKLLKVVCRIHALNIIHGDIKPSNIILDFDFEPFLTDFGMVSRVGKGKELIIVGTYAYLYPSIRGSASKDSTSTRTKIRGNIGPYIDIYALGIVLMQMLTGQVEPPEPLSQQRLAALILEKNIFARNAGSASNDCLAKSIVQMLSVSPGEEGAILEDVAGVAESLAKIYRDSNMGTSPPISFETGNKTELSIGKGYLADIIRDVNSLNHAVIRGLNLHKMGI